MEIKNKHFQVIFTNSGIEIWTGRGHEYALIYADVENDTWALTVFCEVEELKNTHVVGSLPTLVEWINTNL